MRHRRSQDFEWLCSLSRIRWRQMRTSESTPNAAIPDASPRLGCDTHSREEHMADGEKEGSEGTHRQEEPAMSCTQVVHVPVRGHRMLTLSSMVKK